MCKDGDILVEIPGEDLPELSKLYEKHLDTAFDAYCAIDNGIKWREKTKDNSMIFLSPNNSWRKDGTFILLMELIPNSYDIFPYTLAGDCKNLSEGLRDTKRINYTGECRVLFFSVRDQHYGPIKHIAMSKVASPLVVVDTELLYVSIEEALQFDISVPDDVCVAPLKLADAATVDSAWPYKYYGSQGALERLIDTNGGLGVYLRGTPRQLAAWVVRGWLGQMVLLQVAEGHQRRGYAALLLRTMAREIAAGGQVPYGTVVTKNTGSLNLFRKLHFRSAGITHFFSWPHKK